MSEIPSSEVANAARAFKAKQDELAHQHGELREQHSEASSQEWQQQIATTRAQLAQFVQEEDAQRQQEIRQGLHRLVVDTYGGEAIRPVEHIDWNAVKAAFAAFAERHLPDEKPDAFRLEAAPQAKAGIRQIAPGIVTPRNLSMVIDRYGLLQSPMTYQEISEKYGFGTRERSREHLARTTRVLKKDEGLRNLVTDDQTANQGNA